MKKRNRILIFILILLLPFCCYKAYDYFFLKDELNSIEIRVDLDEKGNAKITSDWNLYYPDGTSKKYHSTHTDNLYKSHIASSGYSSDRSSGGGGDSSIGGGGDSSGGGYGGGSR